MKIKQLLAPVLLAGGVLGLHRLLSARTGPEKSAQREASYDAVDAYVRQQMQRLHIPGASLAIIEGDEIVHQRGFGQARPGGETPTPQTPFFIGSITKSITALGIMQLVEAGLLELDAPVQRYLPWFHLADPEASAQITLRHLLNQTSGLPLWPSEIAMADFDDRPDAVERQVRALYALKLTRAVGSKWEYSNFNFNILGLVIETVTGEPYAEYIQAHIFTPLKMIHSYASKAAAAQDGLAVGNRHWFSLPFPAFNLHVPQGSLPSGQLISCAEDIAHYLIAHLNGGKYGGKQILSAAGIDELHRGVVDCTMYGITTGKYGMGWFEIDLGQTTTFSHGGNVPDFSAFMALLPVQNKAFVLLLNADPYGLPVIIEEVGMGTAAILAGQQPPPIKLDFIQWIMRLLPLIPLLQLVGILTTLQRLSDWRQNPRLRPSVGRTWGRYILLPLVPDLALSGLLVYLQSSRMMRYFHLFMPDVAWIARVSGGLASIWALLRTSLVLQTIRKPRS